VEAMYLRTLTNSAQTRRFTIEKLAAAGWEVRVEQDSRVVSSTCYRDWHRVERARNAFAREAARLQDDGWTDHSTNR
jgi:hypothetical protein